jgi:hypothetical protein
MFTPSGMPAWPGKPWSFWDKGAIMIEPMIDYRNDQVMEELGIKSEHTLAAWRIACPYLHGKPFESKPATITVNQNNQWASFDRTYQVEVTAGDLVLLVKERMEQARSGRWEDVTGRAWLSLTRASEWTREVKPDFSNNNLVIRRREKKITGKKFGFLEGAGGKSLWFPEDEVLEYRSAIAATPASRAEAKAREQDRREKRQRQLATKFNGIYNGRMNITAAARHVGLSRASVERAVNIGQLQSEPKKPPTGHCFLEATVDTIELEKWAKEKPGLTRQELIPHRFKTGNQLAEHFDITKRQERIGLTLLLAKLRELEQIPSNRYVRRIDGSRKRWGQIWHYDLHAFKNWLGPRNIHQAVKEARLEATREARRPAPARKEEPTPTGSKGKQATVINRAIAILIQDPGLTNREIAKRVGCNPSYLSLSGKFKKLRATFQQANLERLPSGTKRHDGTIEAIDRGQEDY